MKQIKRCLAVLVILMVLTACGDEMDSEMNLSQDTEASLVENETENGSKDIVESLMENLSVNRTVIYEDQGLILTLSTDHLPTENTRNLYLIAELTEGEQRSFSVDTFVINDELISAESVSFDVSTDQTRRASLLSALSRELSFAGISEIQQISFHLNVSDENYNVIAEEDISLELPQKLEFFSEAGEFYGASAQPQILMNTDQAEVEVIYCGMPPEEYGFYVYIICKVTNKTNEALPFAVNEAAVNGMSLDYYSSHRGSISIEGNQTEFVEIHFYVNNLEEAEISTIRDISLLISTTKSEVNGGGSWYDLVIESGDDADEMNYEEMQLLDSYGEVSVYLTGMSLKGREGEELRYYWDLLIVNGGEENIALGVSNSTVNGENVEEGSLGVSRPFLQDSEVGAGKVLKTKISLYRDAADPCTSAELCFQFLRNGEVELLHTGDEISLPMDFSLLEKVDGISVYPSGQEMDYEDGVSYFCWTFYAVNLSDHAVNIALLQSEQDGIASEEIEEEERLFLRSEEIPAGEGGYVTLRIPEIYSGRYSYNVFPALTIQLGYAWEDGSVTEGGVLEVASE